MHARWAILPLALLFTVRCNPFSATDEPAPAEDAGAVPVAPPGAPDPEDPPPVADDDAGVLPDAGCAADASVDEPFSVVDLSSAGYSVVTGGDGTIGKDPVQGTPAPSLHVVVGGTNGTKAYLRRAFCGATAPIVCELSIKTNALTEGNAAFFELRGKRHGVATIVRLKTNELQRSDSADASVARMPLAVSMVSMKEFATVTLTVSPTTSTASISGLTASIADGLDTIDELRTGIMYLNRTTNAMAPGADLLLDELHCAAPRPK